MAVLGFHHAAISRPDIDRLVAFYKDLFGFETAYEDAWDPGVEAYDRMMALEGTAARIVMLRTGNSFLEFFQFSSPEPKPQVGDRPVVDHGITHICIAVDDAVAECARLEAAGLRLHTPPGNDPSAVRGTYARDPDGNVVEILEVNDEGHPLAFSNRALAAVWAAGE